MYNDWAPARVPHLMKLQDDSGLIWRDYKESLPRPNYLMSAVRDAGTWAAIFLCLVLLKWFPSIPTVGICLILMTLLMHRILLVLHEGAHENLLPDSRLNDLYGNAIAGWFVLSSVGNYRLSHALHHQDLGGSMDTEDSYRERVDFTLFLAIMTGLKSFGIVRKRRRLLQNRLSSGRFVEFSRSQSLFLVGSVVLHLVLFAFIFWLFGPAAALVWAIAAVVAMPALAIVRNILEHRFMGDLEARMTQWVSESQTQIGPHLRRSVTTRNFVGPASRIIGVMGFRYHLIHHWDPTVHYSQLGNARRFLSGTGLGAVLLSGEATYLRTLYRLVTGQL